jgi:MFS family permease
MNLITWLRDAAPHSRRALLAASLGWMLDSFDIMLFAFVLPRVMADLHLSKASAGLLGSFTLIAAAIGGILFGLAADRFGRVRALIASVCIYAFFTACCGFAVGFVSLAVFRILLGFGVGGEWATGSALVCETWPAEHRDKALALMQSAFAIGYGLAALVAFALLPLVGWRGVFFVGLAPALISFWVRHHIPEPEAWKTLSSGPKASSRAQFTALFCPPLLGRTAALTLMNACCMFAWWGFNLWVPSYFSLSAARGGIGFSPRTMTGIIVVMQIGMWLGYVSFGYLATAFGRRRVYVTFLVSAALLTTAFAATRSPWILLLLGPCLAFTATGYFSGFAAVTAETYPTRIRATGQGFSYNLGRLASAIAPFAAGSLADHHGFGAAFHLQAAAFLVAAAFWIFLPNTKPSS